MERSPDTDESGKRLRKSTTQQVLDVLTEFKADLEIDPETFEDEFREFDDCPGITKLFQAAGMDQGNIAHWQLILLACANCLFLEDEDFSPRGRPTVWTDDVEDSLISWWFAAKMEFGGRGIKALFEAMINKYGPFPIGPSHVMGDAETLRGRFEIIKVAARAAVQNDCARESQMKLIEELAKAQASSR